MSAAGLAGALADGEGFELVAESPIPVRGTGN